MNINEEEAEAAFDDALDEARVILEDLVYYITNPNDWRYNDYTASEKLGLERLVIALGHVAYKKY